MTGGVDDVDRVIAPDRAGRGGLDGDAALLLLLEVVHRGGTVVHLPDFVDLLGKEQDALGDRRLAGIDVGHDADVAVRCEALARRV